MKVYLGDLFHTWTKGGIWTIPLNVGYVGSYLKKKMAEAGIDTQIRLFKDPYKLLDAIDDNPPDVVGLGFGLCKVFQFNKTFFNEGRNTVVRGTIGYSNPAGDFPCRNGWIFIEEAHHLEARLLLLPFSLTSHITRNVK